jgi:hypothetical protein
VDGRTTARIKCVAPAEAKGIDFTAVEIRAARVAAKSAPVAGFSACWTQKRAKNDVFQRKTRKNRKKPVETRVCPLTIASESRKVNGGRFFRSRINTGFGTGWERSYSGDLEEKTKEEDQWQQQ